MTGKILLISVPLLLLSLTSCSKSAAPEIPEDAIHLNICVLGNSYSNDSFSYVPFILKDYGFTCELHIYYRSGGSLQGLDDQWYDTENPGDHYYVNTTRDNKWKKGDPISPNEILSLSQWDIISLQQYSRHVTLEETYTPYLQNILDRIEDNFPGQHKMAWFMAYNRAAENDVEINLSLQQKVVSSYPFDIVFPVATTIFNCQSSSVLRNIGDSVYGNFFSDDNAHLQEGLPCYAAALTVVQTILDIYAPDKTIVGDKVRPTEKWITSIGGITRNGTSTGVTESNCALVQKAVIAARNDHFSVTPMD